MRCTRPRERTGVSLARQKDPEIRTPTPDSFFLDTFSKRISENANSIVGRAWRYEIEATQCVRLSKTSKFIAGVFRCTRVFAGR